MHSPRQNIFSMTAIEIASSSISSMNRLYENGLQELALHVPAHVVEIDVLEIAERAVVEQHHDGDYFS